MDDEPQVSAKEAAASATAGAGAGAGAGASGGFNDLNAEDIETNWEEVTESFDDMGLKEDLLRGIYAYGYLFPFFKKCCF